MNFSIYSLSFGSHKTTAHALSSFSIVSPLNFLFEKLFQWQSGVNLIEKLSSVYVCVFQRRENRHRRGWVHPWGTHRRRRRGCVPPARASSAAAGPTSPWSSSTSSSASLTRPTTRTPSCVRNSAKDSDSVRRASR